MTEAAVANNQRAADK
jgi:hypothetical protein